MKITKATFKSFIKNNSDNLLIKVSTQFDSMTDCIQCVRDEFTSVQPTTVWIDNNLGIVGIYLVGGSRNYFTAYEDGSHKGIRWSNCCGSGIIAVKC